MSKYMTFHISRQKKKQNSVHAVKQNATIEALVDVIKEMPYYVTLFDQSNNQVSQMSHMDLRLQF